jgi:hypothetical protein
LGSRKAARDRRTAAIFSRVTFEVMGRLAPPRNAFARLKRQAVLPARARGVTATEKSY